MFDSGGGGGNNNCPVNLTSSTPAPQVEGSASTHEKQKQSYTCECCHKPFSADSFLTHIGEVPYSCDLCDKTFDTFLDLKRHETTHGEKTGMVMDYVNEKSGQQTKRVFSCKVCQMSFRRYFSLQRHAKSDFHRRRIVQESLCKIFYQQKSMKSRLSSTPSEHSRSSLLQNAVPVYIPRRMDQMPHMETSEFYTGASDSDVSRCSQNSQSSESPKPQANSGAKSSLYTCKCCNKSFSGSSYLKHIEQMTYTCQVCRMSFDSSLNLKMHELTHVDMESVAYDVSVKSIEQKIMKSQLSFEQSQDNSRSFMESSTPVKNDHAPQDTSYLYLQNSMQ